MSPALRAVRVLHPCLEPHPGSVPLATARLTDQQRISVLLQAAGLLSLLDRAGWMVQDWSGARVTSAGRLTFPEDSAAAGISERHAQEILRELLGRMFRYEGSAALSGRGPARRAARLLLDRWFQSLAPIAPDEAVTQILNDSPFLWEHGFAEARAALAGELDDGNQVRFWVAGPRPFRSRLLASCRTAVELRELLVSGEAWSAWDGNGEVRGLALITDEAKIQRAQALSVQGRSRAALAVLDGLRSNAAEAVRARCQLHLGQLGAARATLRRIKKGRLTAEQAIDLADTATRVLANSGDTEGPRAWIQRALELAGPAQGAAWLHAGLVAAVAAWDRRDLSEMNVWLEDTKGAREVPDLAWRWHLARGRSALNEPAQGTEAVAQLGRAIRTSRRTLSRQDAAGLWNELGLGRTKVGDLAGAERAFLHAARLLEGCDGPRKTTLALPNLAEIRLRRGRLDGVLEILERTSEENRLAGNLRGLVQDTGLRARFELVLGRPAAALELCRQALGDLARHDSTWHAEELQLLAARALGWLHRQQEAAEALARVPPAVFEELEPEERPAALAHAGKIQDALREAEGTPFEPLWNAVLSEAPAPLPSWEALSILEPYRAARLVFDLSLLCTSAAEAIPAPWLRSAAATLRQIGAHAQAESLEARDQGPWQAMAIYLGKRPGDPALADLFDQIGLREEDLAGAEDARSRALGALARRDRAIREEPPPRPEEPQERRVPAGSGEMVGESAAFRAALDRMDRLAQGSLPILILGESGTGKELAARRIHRASARARGPFVPVNCAALSETLILSELFGHARGAFTGADRDRKGSFEAASGGTIFLDEIGDLPLTAQGMLLRTLQEKEVRPVGEPLPRKIDVRVLAATHRNLETMVVEGSFREDLYYRLKGANVKLPPLRDRGEDVLLLADRILARQDPSPAPKLVREARALLLTYSWPGNIRELQNVLSLSVMLAAGDSAIRAEHLELPEMKKTPTGSYHEQVDAVRRKVLSEALEKHGWNQTEVSRELGLSRQSISYLVRRFRLA
ncbi:MAG TPA: sigma 54-interacting transcriptional regulator [Thermoanaerobaculia bacterium]|nr:sigma 54-interacting transcriptional regulator [Thermoanaerobaculia bacterium]